MKLPGALVKYEQAEELPELLRSFRGVNSPNEAPGENARDEMWVTRVVVFLWTLSLLVHIHSHRQGLLSSANNWMPVDNELREGFRGKNGGKNRCSTVLVAFAPPWCRLLRPQQLRGLQPTELRWAESVPSLGRNNGTSPKRPLRSHDVYGFDYFCVRCNCLVKGFACGRGGTFQRRLGKFWEGTNTHLYFFRASWNQKRDSSWFVSTNTCSQGNLCVLPLNLNTTYHAESFSINFLIRLVSAANQHEHGDLHHL